MLRLGDLFDSTGNTIPLEQLEENNYLSQVVIDSNEKKTVEDFFIEIEKIEDDNDPYSRSWAENEELLIREYFEACERDDWVDSGLYKRSNGRYTVMENYARALIELYIQHLEKSFENTSAMCHPFESLFNDVESALSYNLKYFWRKEHPLTKGDVFYSGRWNCSGGDIWEDLYKEGQYPFSFKDLVSGFCRYSSYVLFIKGQDEGNGNADITQFLFCNNNKRQTFRAMLNNFCIGSKQNDIMPQPEDKWLLEKLTGFSTVTTLYNYFTGNDIVSRSESLEISKRVLSILMTCKPLQMRICLTELVAKELAEFPKKATNTIEKVYENKIFEDYIIGLKRIIGIINSEYSNLLSCLFALSKDGAIATEKLLDTSFERYPSYKMEFDLEFRDYDDRLYLVLFQTVGIRDVMRKFPIEDIPKKIYEKNRDEMGRFAELQRVAIEAACSEYNIII